jgi:hypothetical protein
MLDTRHGDARSEAMGFGRLIRVGNRRGGAKTTVYVVAEAEPGKAIDILKLGVSGPFDEYEDLGRVSEKLLVALDLQPGQFSRT